MADEAFALSPISARATLLSEADYDAISDAFMETSRGRWFLSEYAKRNRNADTRMVLDAVARIEQNIAAEKERPGDDRLPEALATLRGAVEEAKAAASQAVGALVGEQSLAPIRRGARVIREILEKLREIGADGRIYDLIDGEVRAIEAGCGQVASIDVSAVLSGAFDLIDRRIEGLIDDDPDQSSTVETAPSPSVAADERTADAAAAPAPLFRSATEDVAALPSENNIATEQTEVTSVDTALDDALDMIALEMAAPDPAEDDADELYAAEPVLAEPDIVTPATEPAVAPQPQPLQPSLGASLIANGIVRRPDTSTDPLAPIRRMSQAEKIAFFS